MPLCLRSQYMFANFVNGTLFVVQMDIIIHSLIYKEKRLYLVRKVTNSSVKIPPNHKTKGQSQTCIFNNTIIMATLDVDHNSKLLMRH